MVKLVFTQHIRVDAFSLQMAFPRRIFCESFSPLAPVHCGPDLNQSDLRCGNLKQQLKFYKSVATY